MPKITQFGRPNRVFVVAVIAKDLLAENVAYLFMVCSLSLKYLRELVTVII